LNARQDVEKWDRELLAVRHVEAFQQSEFVAIDVGNLVETPDGFPVY
jgi:hypothetical protein